MNEITQQIEALLFISGEGLTIERLSKSLSIDIEEIRNSLNELKAHYKENHMLTIVDHGDKISLTTSESASLIVKQFAKEEFSGELTSAALETLAIITYKDSIKRSEIDYIRGVNSSFILRNLLVRGLIERGHDPKDSRSFIYSVSTNFLKHLGISSLKELPEYNEFANKLNEELAKSTEETADKQII
jgi:segregation and condensation protein B